MKARFILFIFLLSALTTSFAQTNNGKTDYLAKNYATWDGEGFANIKRVFTPEVLKNQLFLIGEGHGIKYSYDIQFNLVAYLQKTAGIRYLLVELGYIDGLMLNNYLQTGDESKYEAVFAGYAGTYYYNKSVHEFYRKLYALNRSLPAEKSIMILPVDIEFGHRKAIKYLQQNIFTGDNANTPVGVAINKIDAEKGVGKDIANEIIKLYPAYKADSALYKKALGKLYFDATFLLRNTYERLSIALKGNSDTRRDSVMLENFNIYKQRYKLQNQKLMGLFGGFHIKQTDQPKDLRFAALLKRSAAVKGLCSALMVYNGGYAMSPKPNRDTIKTGNIYRQAENLSDYCIQSVSDGDLLEAYHKTAKGVLFNLSAKGNPFKGDKSFLMGKDQYANINEMYQLLILINDSPATEPFMGGMDKP
ncbi:hypothetical protein IDJ77_18975 [Mucilaginibacter sp. ZT4R22]|uniref:Erythromycin esterase n=1 Tax=Mucilaginibacter pankratovii TaxID=2772110 RepID=A0ABR7WUE1_9SPHI|nr:hypothetical protein [Mucilaginibacter pankratovii]MBD1365905.1 hypothetical protein [Mucilaginibacter pankratovii]